LLACLIVFCLLSSGCRLTPKPLPEVIESSISQEEDLSDTLSQTVTTQPEPALSQRQNTPELPDIYRVLLDHFNEWQGVPYQLGGLSKKGIDCSGFTQLTYARLFDFSLPRTTDAQSNTGHAISAKQLATGDLVFFRTGWRQRHVGIYLQDQVFLHASTSRGVILSRMDNPYWQKHFWKAVRPTAELQLSAQAYPVTDPRSQSSLSGEL